MPTCSTRMEIQLALSRELTKPSGYSRSRRIDHEPLSVENASSYASVVQGSEFRVYAVGAFAKCARPHKCGTPNGPENAPYRSNQELQNQTKSKEECGKF